MASDAEDASPDPDLHSDFDDTEDMAEAASKPPANKAESNASGSSDHHASANGNTKPNPKDPSRPRRKKARRACFACQRAHLTCGDERPCARCIKRGLQDQCADGVRKKAKYLSDTPAEMLNPPMAGGYHPYLNGTKASSTSSASGVPMSGSNQAGHYHHPPQTPTIDVYGQPSQPHMPPPLSTAGSFGGSQPSPVSPQFSQHQTQQGLPASMSANPQNVGQFNGMSFDPSDPAIFNFDIASLNFGNQYGALEFGMLNHMSAGANGENHPHILNQVGHMQNYDQNYQTDPSLTFGQDAFMNADWNSSHPRAESTSGLLQTPNNTPIVTSIDRNDGITQFPKAYAIGAGPSSMASASPAASTGVPEPAPPEQPKSPALFLNTSQPPASPAIQRLTKQQPVQPVSASTDAYNQPVAQAVGNPRKRPYNADYIYETVNEPYKYTQGFHRLFNYISRNFSTEKRNRIAKAVSAIRPSLITFSQGLTEQDLIFMERSVQRKLFEYSEYFGQTGTPCLLARRDGAILGASKEFTILTNWNKGVLLGREPNLNMNQGGASGASTAPGSASRTRVPSSEAEERPGDRPSNMQPAPAAVQIAEVLDQDTVVQFYEDFARLAFDNSGISPIRRGKLLMYRTKEDLQPGGGVEEDDPERPGKKRKRTQSIKQEPGQDHSIKSEANIMKLGEKEGVVDVMYCWNVRRDVFEVPTLIAMNFLPII